MPYKHTPWAVDDAMAAIPPEQWSDPRPLFRAPDDSDVARWLRNASQGWATHRRPVPLTESGKAANARIYRERVEAHGPRIYELRAAGAEWSAVEREIGYEQTACRCWMRDWIKGQPGLSEPVLPRTRRAS